MADAALSWVHSYITANHSRSGTIVLQSWDRSQHIQYELLHSECHISEQMRNVKQADYQLLGLSDASMPTMSDIWLLWCCKAVHDEAQFIGECRPLLSIASASTVPRIWLLNGHFKPPEFRAHDLAGMSSFFLYLLVGQQADASHQQLILSLQWSVLLGRCVVYCPAHATLCINYTGTTLCSRIGQGIDAAINFASFYYHVCSECCQHSLDRRMLRPSIG